MLTPRGVLMGRPRDMLEEQRQIRGLAPRMDLTPEGMGQGLAAAEIAACVAHLVDEPYPPVRAQLPMALATLPRRDRQLL